MDGLGAIGTMPEGSLEVGYGSLEVLLPRLGTTAELECLDRLGLEAESLRIVGDCTA